MSDFVSVEEAIKMVKASKTVVANTAFLAESEYDQLHIRKREMLKILHNMLKYKNTINVFCTILKNGEAYIDNGEDLLFHGDAF
jgi:hypothetical protein